MHGYEKTLDWFFRLAMDTIRKEDLALRNLLLNRPGYEDYYAGVAAAFEAGLVYAIFKDLLSSPFALEHHVDWESKVSERTFVDLWLRRRGQGNREIGVEVKWWERSPQPVAQDLEKLREQCKQNNISHGAVLVLRGRAKGGQSTGLRELIEQNLGRGEAFGNLTRVPTEDRFGTLDSWWPKAIPATIEVALLDVL